MAGQAAVAADLGAEYMFTSASGGGMSLAEAGERLRRLGDAVGAHEVFLALETHPELCTNAGRMEATMAAVDSTTTTAASTPSISSADAEST